MTVDKLTEIIQKKCTKNRVKKLFKDLKAGKNSERNGINFTWRKFLETVFPIKNKYGDKKHNTTQINWDNYLITKDVKLLPLRLLIEFKQQSDYRNGSTLKSQQNRARIAIQLLYYMNTIYQSTNIGEPNVLMGADENEAFVVYTKPFINKYLRNPKIHSKYDWGKTHGIRPSNAYKKDPDLYTSLCTDEILNVRPFSFDRGTFNDKRQELLAMIDTIIQYSHHNYDYKIPITTNSIDSIYFQFHDLIKPHQSPASVEVVNDFVHIITNTDTDHYFIHNDRLNHISGNKIVSSILINANATKEFFARYDYKNVSAKLQHTIFGRSDHLITMSKRRFSGDFWTPDMWAAQANNYMRKIIGTNYKKNCIIWDCASGAKNLTRNLPYKDLYSSTLYKAQVDQGSIYNRYATSFQYNFLKDDININPTSTNYKMPRKLFNDLCNANKNHKTIIFYTNPPYAASGNNRTNDKHPKKGVASKNSTVHQIMKNNYMGKATQQLYAQFFFRIFKLVKDFHLNRVYIAFFTKPRFFSGGDFWSQFNNYFFNHYQWQAGFLIKASEFSDTKATWPVTFSIYKLMKRPHNSIFMMNAYVSRPNNPNPIKIGKHTYRPVSKEQSLSYWGRQTSPEMINDLPYATTNYPQLSSGLKPSKGKKPQGSLYKHSLGYLRLDSDNVESQKYVYLMSGSAYHGHGFNIMPNKKSLNRAVVAFASRLCIKPTWLNAQDNFKAPDTTKISHQEWNDFVNNCLVYSLFTNNSDQCSYRNPKWSNSYPGIWNNKWFWMSPKDICNLTKNLSDPFSKNIYNEALKAKPTYIYQQLKSRHLTKIARLVLKYANDVIRDSINFRQIHPTVKKGKHEYNTYLNTWDAGWYQIKQMKDQISNLTSYKNFSNVLGKRKSYTNLVKIPKLKELGIYTPTLTDAIATEVYKLNMLLPPITNIPHHGKKGQQNLFKLYLNNN